MKKNKFFKKTVVLKLVRKTTTPVLGHPVILFGQAKQVTTVSLLKLAFRCQQTVLLIRCSSSAYLILVSCQGVSKKRLFYVF